MQQNTPQKPQTPSDESYRFYQLLLFNFSQFIADEEFNRYWDVFTGEKGFETLAPEDKPWETEGANLEEYFNYGFNEKTWSGYAKKLREKRNHNSGHNSQNKISNHGLRTKKQNKK
ncbi:hypothetical protein EDI_219610 [Entamoeba dispar SAW760]|uniref:Pre-mRNA polyadenylation factor Fip1 domain-containing protein n=1 Tax=Entamoeba dispar (strain ATCC PRA-260 / SAW760) TaxID=370354 RepID=B0EQ99_ENTDS|nr:uncharacterized protein EDI_219610 [Entamoeba dispar SAW760]EDR23322.1 hypothetical protein EDI_219610 [Entamoeba dispar SAW760]|eukprot:EDR23322.1 hypothetical protein EDI_219610 [Entamoeba dispar SAW760]